MGRNEGASRSHSITFGSGCPSAHAMDPTNLDSTSSACTFLQGYNELESLERPLFSSQDEGDDYERAHGVAPPQSHRPAGGRPGGASFSTVGLPTQVGLVERMKGNRELCRVVGDGIGSP